MDTSSILVNAFSILSLIFYSVVYFPQIYLIIKTKKAEGLSLLMLLLWTQADGLSLIGSILVGMTVNLIVIGWYHFLVGVITICIVMRYSTNESKTERIFICIAVVIDILLCMSLNVYIRTPELFWGDIVGWFTAVVYVVGRFPQMYMNYKRASTEGLAVGMYILTVLGNVCYLTSLLLYSSEPGYIRTNMPWIIVSVCLVLLDFVVFGQIWWYAKETKTDEYTVV